MLGSRNGPLLSQRRERLPVHAEVPVHDGLLHVRRPAAMSRSVSLVNIKYPASFMWDSARTPAPIARTTAMALPMPLASGTLPKTPPAPATRIMSNYQPRSYQAVADPDCEVFQLRRNSAKEQLG